MGEGGGPSAPPKAAAPVCRTTDRGRVEETKNWNRNSFLPARCFVDCLRRRTVLFLHERQQQHVLVPAHHQRHAQLPVLRVRYRPGDVLQHEVRPVPAVEPGSRAGTEGTGLAPALAVRNGTVPWFRAVRRQPREAPEKTGRFQHGAAAAAVVRR